MKLRLRRWLARRCRHCAELWFSWAIRLDPEDLLGWWTGRRL